MWRHRLWFFSSKQTRRHTSPALSSPSAGFDDYGSHGHRNHQLHDRIQNGRSELMEKENLARGCFRGDLCNCIYFYPNEGHEREVSVSGTNCCELHILPSQESSPK
ncbi:hypothetical protein M5K25_001282 [Dendrobium thyrsiflorum]|uniref:Uncharacterized protein n=1 Tax=Dendrobium thyrsiflorum TaxID=117978 RepID=A0ABD0VR71_DENTH